MHAIGLGNGSRINQVSIGYVIILAFLQMYLLLYDHSDREKSKPFSCGASGIDPPNKEQAMVFQSSDE